jgi:type II secretory pathway component PulL
MIVATSALQLECNVMRKLSAVAFVMIMITTPLPAIAYTQEDADACTPDAMRLCQNAIPDANRVAQCLFQNRQQLSPACTSVFNRLRGASVDRERSVKTQRTNY